MNIIFPIYADVTQLDFTGPAQVLCRIPGATTHVVSHDLTPVPTDSGFSILPTTTYADCPPADVICVPGGPGTAQACEDQRLLEFLGRQVKTAQWITSVCTGMFVLAKLGLVEGRRVTSHWGYTHIIADLGAEYAPGRCVIDGNLVTGGGVTSGMDFALQLAALIAGDEVAQLIQLGLEYDPAPPYECGHPDRAPAALVEKLRPRYDAASAKILETFRS